MAHVSVNYMYNLSKKTFLKAENNYDSFLNYLSPMSASLLWKWRVLSSLVLFQTRLPDFVFNINQPPLFPPPPSLKFTLLSRSSPLSHFSSPYHWNSYLTICHPASVCVCVCVWVHDLWQHQSQTSSARTWHELTSTAILKRGTFRRCCECCFGNSSNSSGCTFSPRAHQLVKRHCSRDQRSPLLSHSG